MSDAVVLRPGQATLSDWRAIYRGAPVELDPVSRADVEAGAAALAGILARTDRDKTPEGGNGGPAMVELLHKNGGYLPAAIVRIFVALKLASLAQGMSGVRWEVVARLSECLAREVLPAVPAGNVSDRLALSHLFAALTGAGEVLVNEKRPSATALKRAGLLPIKLNTEERTALLSGTQLSTALALAGLFEAERVLQSALVATAVSTLALSNAESTLHPRVHKLHRQRGQIDVASAGRALMGAGGSGAESESRETLADVFGAAQIYPRMGACLDLLRQAGTTLESAANAVSEDPLVFWQTEEIVAGLEDASSVSFAADMIALAIREIGNLAEQRIAALPSPSNGEAVPGEAANGTTPRSMAAAFNAENQERVDSGGSDAESEARLSSADSVRRLLPMAGTAALVVAIELLVANRDGDAHRPERVGGAVDRVRRLLRERIPQSAGESGLPAADLAAAADLVRSGDVAAAPGFELPSVIRPEPAAPARQQRARTGHP